MTPNSLKWISNTTFKKLTFLNFFTTLPLIKILPCSLWVFLFTVNLLHHRRVFVVRNVFRLPVWTSWAPVRLALTQCPAVNDEDCPDCLWSLPFCHVNIYNAIMQCAGLLSVICMPLIGCWWRPGCPQVRLLLNLQGRWTAWSAQVPSLASEMAATQVFLDLKSDPEIFLS